MTYPTILLTASEAAIRCDVCAWLTRFGYEVVTAGSAGEALAVLRASHAIGVLVADVSTGGLTLAHEARAIRPNIGVVYTAAAPHRIKEAERVSGAPILRTPYAAHQLMGVIAGLNQRVLNESSAA